MISGLLSPKDSQGRSIDLKRIGGLLGRIVRSWNPSAIWLFGSRARGTAGPESDWDLLVVVRDDQKDVDDPHAAGRLARESRVPSDLILCRAGDFEGARETPNTLVYEATHHGVLIYES